jgi:hypothetical protein
MLIINGTTGTSTMDPTDPPNRIAAAADIEGEALAIAHAKDVTAWVLPQQWVDEQFAQIVAENWPGQSNADAALIPPPRQQRVDTVWLRPRSARRLTPQGNPLCCAGRAPRADLRLWRRQRAPPGRQCKGRHRIREMR